SLLGNPVHASALSGGLCGRANLSARSEACPEPVNTRRSWLVLAVPPVVQPDGPVAPRGAGDQVELVGLGVVVEQPGALARNVGEQVHVELVDQVEPHE